MMWDGADLASNYDIHEFYAGWIFLSELRFGKFKLQETQFTFTGMHKQPGEVQN